MTGDISIDLLKTSKQREELYRTLESNDFANLVHSPTHNSRDSTTLIDAFITNIEDRNQLSGVVGTHVSDHLPIFRFLKQTTSIGTANDISFTVRDVNARSLNNFINEILIIDWSAFLPITDRGSAYGYSHEKFKAYKKCFRHKVFKPVGRSRKARVIKQRLNEIRAKRTLF